MKNVFASVMILSLAMMLLLTGCASQETTTQTGPTTSVPGEHRDGGDVTPGVGPSGASANVHF